MRPSINLKSVFSRLPLNPSDEEVQRLAAAVVACALACDQPRKSIATTYRHHVDGNDRLAPRVRTRIREAVDTALLAAPGTRNPARHLLEPLLTLVEAAGLYGLPVQTFRERMREWQFRRALGWPRHDGREWRFNSIVFDPNRSTALFSSLPEREPWPPPPGCDPQPTEVET